VTPRQRICQALLRTDLARVDLTRITTLRGTDLSKALFELLEGRVISRLPHGFHVINQVLAREIADGVRTTLPLPNRH
jgi:hypothetical protein